MKISIDTKEDSHEEIKKVIRMLQNLVGDSQEVFTNQPTSSSSQDTGSVFNNIFGDTSSSSQEATPSEATSSTTTTEPDENSESTEDLFAELFSEEELKKMDVKKESEEEEESEEEIKLKSKDKKYGIEFY